MEAAPTEKTFFQEGSVRVTQARFIAGSRTYAMSNISSVYTYRKQRSVKLEVALIVIGMLCLFSDGGRMFGFAMILLGILLLMLLKDSYSVRIQSNSGVTDGLVSKDKQYIEKIVDAVNEAIVYRG